MTAAPITCRRSVSSAGGVPITSASTSSSRRPRSARARARCTTTQRVIASLPAVDPVGLGDALLCSAELPEAAQPFGDTEGDQELHPGAPRIVLQLLADPQLGCGPDQWCAAPAYH